MARAKLSKEMNLVEMLKLHRYYSLAFELLLSKEQRVKLEEQTSFITVDPNTDDSPPVESKSLVDMEMPDLDDSDLKALKISPLANMENSDRGDQDNSNSKIPVKSAIDLKNDATIGLYPDTMFGVAAASNLVSQEVTV